MSFPSRARRFCWLCQKVSRKFFSTLIRSDSAIQLNQTLAKDCEDTHIATYSKEKIGRNNYKQSSEFRAIFDLRDPIINPKSGVVWLHRKIVAESSIWHPAELKRFEPRPLFPEYINESVVVLPDNGYFHFLIEELPRYLEVIKHFPNLLSVYSSSSSSYVRQALQATDGKISNFEAPIQVQRLFLSEKTRGGLMTSNDLARLKDFQRRFPVIDTRETKIFVYRSDPVGSQQYTQRGLHKQKQILKELLNEGFQLVRLEDLSLQDQIQLFSGAQHIAGFHGAGLANQIWMPPGGRVTEFVGNRRTQHFRHLARLGGHDYTEKLID